ncbi:hypothetical protein B0H14DRAFT_2629658 [Mycena olivaceomarginata]|nr:hypothetical protein B0H14DRAFT_2629658 [Mycena olivaceomarginata]
MVRQVHQTRITAEIVVRVGILRTILEPPPAFDCLDHVHSWMLHRPGIILVAGLYILDTHRNGKFCMEPVRNTEQNPDNDFCPVVYDGLGMSRVENVALDKGAIIFSCTENDYHDICVRSKPVSGPARRAIATGLELHEPSAIFHTAEPPGMEFKTHRWRHVHNKGDVMDNSWFRIHFLNDFKSDHLLITTHGTDAWPSQANHIFSRLQTTSNFEDYDRPAYQSLDPSGANCLSSEDAKVLGFPALHIGTLFQTRTWDGSTYAGIHRFHQGKGWNPEGQDLVRHLGHPLYDLSSALVGPFANGEPEGPLIRRSPSDHTIEPDELLRPCQETDPQKCWEFGHYL